jgi:hypothetical protein
VTILGITSSKLVWSEPKTIAKGHNFSFSGCKDNYFLVYSSNVADKEFLYSKTSRDSSKWSKPKTLLEFKRICSDPYITHEGDKTIIFFCGELPSSEKESSLIQISVYFIKTEDCENWSSPVTTDAFDLEMENEEKFYKRLLCIELLRNGKYAALWEIHEKHGDMMSSRASLFYCEYENGVRVSQEEVISTDLGESILEERIFENSNGEIMIVVSDLSDVHLIQKEGDKWNYSGTVNVLGEDPMLFQWSPNEYWLFYSSDGDIYYSISPDLRKWNPPQKAFNESSLETHPFLYMSPDGKPLLFYESSKDRYMCDEEKEYFNCEVKMRYLISHGIKISKIMRITITTLFALLFTGFTELLFKKLRQDS